MGIVRVGPPNELILQLGHEYDLKDFIETGTFTGKTALWAAAHFDRVVTIENSEALYNETKPKLDPKNNIKFIKGNSRTALPGVLAELTLPSVLWLDSHWSGGRTYGENDECPLLDEIRSVNRSDYTHFIFIDDARLFTSPPPRPHDASQWPTIIQVLDTLKSSSHNYYIVIIEDVIIAVPMSAKSQLVRYCQDLNTKLFDAWLKRQKWSLPGRGFNLIRRSIAERLPVISGRK